MFQVLTRLVYVVEVLQVGRKMKLRKRLHRSIPIDTRQCFEVGKLGQQIITFGGKFPIESDCFFKKKRKEAHRQLS